jgi:hypothetical protein
VIKVYVWKINVSLVMWEKTVNGNKKKRDLFVFLDKREGC